MNKTFPKPHAVPLLKPSSVHFLENQTYSEDPSVSPVLTRRGNRRRPKKTKQKKTTHLWHSPCKRRCVTSTTSVAAECHSMWKHPEHLIIKLIKPAHKIRRCRWLKPAYLVCSNAMFGEHWSTEDKHLSIVKLWRTVMMMACEVEQWSRHEKPSSPRRFTGANQWSIESHTTLCEKEGGRGGGEAATVVQHVRVIPQRLLNFGSHKVTVYGCFSVVKHKAVWYFAFFFFAFVSVSAQEIRTGKELEDWNTQVENVKLVTWSSINQFVLYFYSSPRETLMFMNHVGKKVQVILIEISHIILSCVRVFVWICTPASKSVRARVTAPFHICSHMCVCVCVCVCVCLWYGLPKTCCSPLHTTHIITQKIKWRCLTLTLIHPSSYKSGWLPNISTVIRFLWPLLSLSVCLSAFYTALV